MCAQISRDNFGKSLFLLAVAFGSLRPKNTPMRPKNTHGLWTNDALRGPGLGAREGDSCRFGSGCEHRLDDDPDAMGDEGGDWPGHACELSPLGWMAHYHMNRAIQF